MLHFLKKLVLLIALMVFCFTIEAKNIGVLFHFNSKGRETIIASFRSQFSVKNHRVTFLDSNDSETNLQKKLQDANCEFLFTVGHTATRVAKKMNLPGIFILVTNPIKEGLVDKKGIPTGKMTGISIFAKPLDILEKIKILAPKKKKIALLYDPSVSAESALSIEKSATFLNFELLTKTINNPKEVLPFLENRKGEFDILYGLYDSTVFHPRNQTNIIKFCVRNRVMLIGLNSQMTKHGAAISFQTDFSYLGKQAAKILEQMLHSSDKPNLQFPEKIKYSINEKIAKRLGLKVSRDFKSKASAVFT